MKVRAVAAPSRESNAVGTLECECTPGGLVVVYLGIGAYSEGYAVGAVCRGVRMLFSWPEVLEVDERSDGLWLRLSADRSPHNALLLRHFDAETGPSHQELSKRRRLLFGSLIALGLIVVLGLPPLLAGGGAASYSAASLTLGVVAALGLGALGLIGDRLWLKPPQTSEELQQLFMAELRHYCPRPVPTGRRPVQPEAQLDWSRILLALPRSTAGVALVLTAGSLATLVTSAWILRSGREVAPTRPVAVTPPPPAPPSAPPGGYAEAAKPEAEHSAVAPPPSAAVAQAAAQACRCERADSVLWSSPFPQVSTLVISQRLRAHKKHHHVEVDLAIVNNSQDTLPQAGLLVHFYEAEGNKHTKDRPLFYEGKLRPGRAIKWHVEARGTSFVVENAKQSSIEPSALASADAFADLLQANHRPVRLHGTMMLAYLGDQRAKAGITALGKAQREEESPFLDRVSRTLTDTIVCDIRTADKGRIRSVELCVHNTTLKAQNELGLQLRALDRAFDPRNPVAAPPEVIAEQVWHLPGEFPPQSGRWVKVDFDTDNAAGKVPTAFEGFVDEYRLLY